MIYFVCLLCLTFQRRCCGYPAEWSPQEPTAWQPPARHWAALPQEGLNQRQCCYRHPHSSGPVRVLWGTRRISSRRTPAACHGQPPSPLHWSLRGERVTNGKKTRELDQKWTQTWRWNVKRQVLISRDCRSCRHSRLKKSPIVWNDAKRRGEWARQHLSQ